MFVGVVCVLCLCVWLRACLCCLFGRVCARSFVCLVGVCVFARLFVCLFDCWLACLFVCACLLVFVCLCNC